MSGVSDYVVAIDLGSSKIIGCLGKKEIDGKINILSLEQIPVHAEVRRGVVHNLEEVSKSVLDLVQRLSHTHGHPCVIDHVYVGLNGYTIRTLDLSSASFLSGEELVNERNLDELVDDAQARAAETFDVLEIFTQEFLVDGKSDDNPVGTKPLRIEGRYKIIGGKPAILGNLDDCFSRINLKYEAILGPVASAEAVLRPEDKLKGAVSIDFGAETTSICIYKGNKVRYVAVLPFGGSHITMDLQQLNLDEQGAESYKISKGTAIHLAEKVVDELQISEFEQLSSFDKEANDIIVARIEEIVENIWAQIRYSGIEPQKLMEGIVLTGGTSQIQGLVELIKKKTEMPVRIGETAQRIAADHMDSYNKPEYAQAVGLLLLGKGRCCSVREEQLIVTKKPEAAKLQENTIFDDLPPVVAPPSKVPKPPKPPKPVRPSKLTTFFKGFMNDEDI